MEAQPYEIEVKEKPEITEEERERRRQKKKAYKQRLRAKKQKERESENSLESLERNETEEGKANLQRWEQMCDMIKDYKSKIGRFPNMRSNGRDVNDEASKVLGRWLWLQTVSYKKGNMHPYHIRRLEEIGYNFK